MYSVRRSELRGSVTINLRPISRGIATCPALPCSTGTCIFNHKWQPRIARPWAWYRIGILITCRRILFITLSKDIFFRVLN